MTKHSKRERERRAEETQRVREIESAWAGSVPPATAKAFAMEVEAALARGPAGYGTPSSATGPRAAAAEDDRTTPAGRVDAPAQA